MKLTRRTLLAAAPLVAQTLHEEIVSLTQSPPMAMQFRGSSEKDARAWQKQFGAKLRELLGPFDPPAKWETVEESIADEGDHKRYSLALKAPGHPTLPLYLLVPKASLGKRAGVIALHGHGPHGHDAVVGVKSSDINYDYGLQLARRGYVVAAPCFAPFGRRLGDPKLYRGNDPCAVDFLRLQMLGKLLMAENLRDALWAQKVLEQHPMVDPKRIGCVGLSYGGRMTMLATAVSPNIKVAVISGALNVMQERMRGRHSCGAQVIPGLLQYGDVPEIASLIAPRPCLWEVGQKDALMVKDWIAPSFDRIRRVYKALGAENNLDLDSFDGGHEWHGVKAFPLIGKVLQD
jgi:hypothetical protein